MLEAKVVGMLNSGVGVVRVWLLIVGGQFVRYSTGDTLSYHRAHLLLCGGTQLWGSLYRYHMPYSWCMEEGITALLLYIDRRYAICWWVWQILRRLSGANVSRSV